MNERFDYKAARPRNELLPTLNLLGNQLEKISANLHDLRASDMTEFEAAWKQCSNLQELNVWKCSGDQLQAVFATPKVSLEVLYVTFFRSGKRTYSESNAAWRSCRDEDMNKAEEICKKACKSAKRISVGIEVTASPEYYSNFEAHILPMKI